MGPPETRWCCATGPRVFNPCTTTTREVLPKAGVPRAPRDRIGALDRRPQGDRLPTAAGRLQVPTAGGGMILPPVLTGLLLVALLFLSACSRAADPQAREKELAYLRVLVPETLLEFAHVEVPAVENIAILGEGTNKHLGLHLVPGQKKRSGGIRAEVSVGVPYEEGDTVRYEWQFMVPEDFKSDAPLNRWCIIGQWHDQPDKRRGETWAGFPSRSPPVLIGLGELQGRLGMGIEYGPTQSQKHGPIFIERGKWHHIAVVIHWSQKAVGSATVFFDDMTRPAKTLHGPNMHNGFQHYFKFGMYRHPEIATDNWIHLKDFKAGK